MKDFENKVAVITGGASGVGRSLAFALGRRGARIVVGDDVMNGIIDGLNDDYPIWANKVHKYRPVFCKEDKTLVMFRKWVRQFYLTSKDKREIA